MDRATAVAGQIRLGRRQDAERKPQFVAMQVEDYLFMPIRSSLRNLIRGSDARTPIAKRSVIVL
ncbi:hypothetical protein LB542_15395 [Mesorhizobium sp. BR1-1-9]|uniref:hypothetical protein n=1 Tax=unclassified Mesorhizobium TaxID=325217 RepID=UPI00112E51B3|nr:MULTISPECIES: hypothetical protein [unclassified Mesorhizobium]MBZ9810314.1 hypothetical protein [Mesorhizobium sp. ESP-6-2]MBZ9872241.1 hypothetical protein [Mesorhizobium sp. BR1-1-9]MBZ9943063.1 hypothetical protein [Mesorhizobium sp. BR1-1-13]TPM24939.1 hypothetical protein FJ955_24810 [Mesorhizobium sp. B2-2-2]